MALNIVNMVVGIRAGLSISETETPVHSPSIIRQSNSQSVPVNVVRFMFCPSCTITGENERYHNTGYALHSYVKQYLNIFIF